MLALLPLLFCCTYLSSIYRLIFDFNTVVHCREGYLLQQMDKTIVLKFVMRMVQNVAISLKCWTLLLPRLLWVKQGFTSGISVSIVVMKTFKLTYTLKAPAQPIKKWKTEENNHGRAPNHCGVAEDVVGISIR